jgi:alpha-ketoglutarate-dependent taurine dioxygenase
VLGQGSSFPSLICLSAPVLFVHPAAAVSLLTGNFHDRAKGLAQDLVQGLLGSFDSHIPDVQFQYSVHLLSWISIHALC